jgi:hypothetical protein
VCIWEHELINYHDKPWILQTLTQDASIGINTRIKNVHKKLSKCTHQPVRSYHERKILLEWITKRTKRGYAVGPYTYAQIQSLNYKLHITPTFPIPKGSNDWRIIWNGKWKSHDWLYNVNDLIPDCEAYVRYPTQIEIIKMLKSAGPGAYIFVVDAQDAFFSVPIQIGDYQFMGVRIENKYFIFVVLQMGLKSAPRIYTRFADAIEYIIVNNNKNVCFASYANELVQLIRHYMDDFFGVHKNLDIAWQLYNQIIFWFDKLGVPTRDTKCFHPKKCEKILGHIYDTRLQMVSLSQRQRYRLLENLIGILHQHGAYKKQLEVVSSIRCT